MNEVLSDYYRMTVHTHGPTAISAKLSLLVVLYLVQTGNVKPGQKLLLAVLLVHFLMAAFLSIGSGGLVIVLLLCSLGIAVSAADALIRSEMRWKVLPDEQPWLLLAWVGYLVAFLFPFWKPLSLVKGLFLSPMAALPQQSLIAFLVLLAVTGRQAPPILARICVAAGGAIGLMDMVVGNRLIGVFLLMATAAAVVRQLLPEVSQDSSPEPAVSAPIARPKAAPSNVRPAPPPEDPPEGKSAGKRKWDIR